MIGREPDGFLRIKPPKGVTVWIHRQFVQMLPGSAASLPTTGRSDIPSPGAGASKGGKGVPADTEKASLGTAAGAVSVEGRPSSALAAIADPTLRETLRGLDARAEAELKKPVEQRNFRPLIGEYEKVASGASDETGRRYARARLDQLRYMAKVVETLQELRRMNEKAESQRRRFLEERAELGSKLPPIPSDIDVQGELRTSALYPPGSQPRRFRLVDASGGRERTIGYVEIPPDAKIAVNDLVGRYVGVRASKKRLQAGAINPVPIYVAEDIVPLQPPKTAAAVSPGEH
ncbi:MAG: hypothetical protein D6788_08370 [Planctomycetota bacterium]|nr:MAG: hypothetical protein D6788_08370 [Planctomycetota bacterium]